MIARTQAKKDDLGLDSMGIQKTMRTSDYFIDGTGQFVINIFGGLIAQLTYFYTDKVSISASTVATTLLIVTFFNAFAQIFMGHIMDHMHFKKGIARPWFLYMALPALVVTIAIFTVPKGMGTPMQMAYMLITNILFSSVVCTALSVPYSSLMALRTQSQDERAKMGTFRAASGFVSGSFIAILIIPVTNMLGGNQAAWMKLGLILGVIELLLLLLIYKRSKETVVADESSREIEKEENVSLKEGFNILFHNKYWVLVLGIQFLIQLSFGLTSAQGAYYTKWVLGNDNLLALLGAVGMIPTILGFVLLTPMIKKFGVVKTLKISSCIIMGSNAIRIFMPSSLLGTIIFGGTASFGTIAPMALISVLISNCVDYNEWKTGKRIVGLTNSAVSFGTQIGTGVGAAMVGWILAISAYNPGAAVAQPNSAIFGIYSFAIYIPILIQVLVLLLLSRYDLEEKFPEIIADLQARKEKNKK